MRPNLPARPAFSRLGSMRNHDVSSGDESNDDMNNKTATDTDDAASDKLSVSFSEVDDTDSINEISSVKEKIIEEEDEVDSKDATPKATPTKPPLPPSSRFNSTGSYREPSQSKISSSNSNYSSFRQTPVFQKTPSSETVTCNVTLKPSPELLLEKGAEQINICALNSFAQNILFYLFCVTFKYTCFKRKLSIIMKPSSVSETLKPYDSNLDSTTATATTSVTTKHHKVPLVPGGFVGFASLPDQVYRKSLRKGGHP